MIQQEGEHRGKTTAAKMKTRGIKPHRIVAMYSEYRVIVLLICYNYCSRTLRVLCVHHFVRHADDRNSKRRFLFTGSTWRCYAFLLDIIQAASQQHSQSRTMTMAPAGIPFLHFLIITPFIGIVCPKQLLSSGRHLSVHLCAMYSQITSLFGGAIWLNKLVLHRMWFNRYIATMVIDMAFGTLG
eukprot:gb/GECG01003434.1/.p1 GENE.gb/GECG01003434.1/~~gb/GECG01003434.1/.p1  ORF type:complete len:184 (+),score=2.34 gb/GECG01003434.1/:1-552(+)